MPIDQLLITGIKLLQHTLHLFPERGQLTFGKMVGRLTFLCLGKRRQVALGNIKRVFGDRLTDGQIRLLAKSNFEKLGINIVEQLLVPFLTEKDVAARFTIEGKEIVEKALDAGKGAIALGFHFGNWEVTGVVSKLLGQDIVALARPLKRHGQLNSFVNGLREAAGLTIIVNENTSRAVMRLLKENKMVAILADQREKRSRGVYVELFGTKVPTSKGVAMLGMKTGTAVIPIYAVRRGFLRYTFVCAPPIEMERKGNIEELVELNTRKVNEFLEQIILKYPDEWFWVHRRWGREQRRKRRHH